MSSTFCVSSHFHVRNPSANSKHVTPLRWTTPRHPILSSKKRLGPLKCKPKNKVLEDNTIYYRDGDPLTSKIRYFPFVFWKFLRPHTIRGTILGTASVVIKVLANNNQPLHWPTLLPCALLGLVALLCGNGYIVGINQLYDIDIDVVNKPYLPVASGELPRRFASLLCFALAAIGLSIVSRNFERHILVLYGLGLTLGTAYSVPPVRLKYNPVAAALIIAAVRGVLLNIGVYFATRAAIGIKGVEWTPGIIFTTVFATTFALVIAVVKDLPDTEGDSVNGVPTFAVVRGVQTVARGAILVMLAYYVGGIAAALTWSQSLQPMWVAAAHITFAAVLLWRASIMDKGKYTTPEVKTFYRWIWNLFYAEYLILPFL
nr:homogentisate solanesyltransferase (HSTC), chloroplastic isoform [Polytomella parva]|eukprot:CAMPEP_0175042084 /NCGR_PEP_ID=MMETSP0052_2-20121109/2335_1 /TAXON_ID=51329 ORGANISM="Polytomella parva, Strain SAG 63-3" /NCGR_SAMPLE_ID=MMETSP0052_2 /ASSEMBLY_ACC=CAM_ASM_000194 /LENGTH=372 /DNA_ID=CAMNT_0016304793 /DNA_START=1084 /DNA_END=2202 /DNA_ORIENTATION=+